MLINPVKQRNQESSNARDALHSDIGLMNVKITLLTYIDLLEQPCLSNYNVYKIIEIQN